MGNVCFNIVLGEFRVLVEIVYNSSQVNRYKIKLKEKSFLLEENILKKSDRWKIKEYTADVDLDKLQKALPQIIEEITYYFKPKISAQEKFKGKKSW